MRSLQDEIRQAQANLNCPICGRKFSLQDIQARSFTQSMTIELSMICSNTHAPIILLVPLDAHRLFRLGPIEFKDLAEAEKRIDELSESLIELVKK